MGGGLEGRCVGSGGVSYGLRACQGGFRRWPGGGLEGKYRSSVDAREPQNLTKSEEYQRHLQGVLYIV
eukprot:851577-Pyramimonas_sp.AAC.2